MGCAIHAFLYVQCYPCLYMHLCSQNLCTGTNDILMITFIYVIYGEIYVLITGISILSFELKIHQLQVIVSTINQY